MQCLLLYYSPSSNIDEHSAFWQQIDFDARYQTVCLGSGREAHKEHLGEGQEFVHVVCWIHLCSFRRLYYLVPRPSCCFHSHAQSIHCHCHSTPHLAVTEDEARVPGQHQHLHGCRFLPFVPRYPPGCPVVFAEQPIIYIYIYIYIVG